MKKTDKPIVIWLFTGVVLIALMVIIGGITRLTESGLSMVDWRLISGSFPPLNDVEWQQVFERYKQYPEFKELNYKFTLSDFKTIFWWEYIHRTLGRVIGLVFIVPFIYFWVKKRLSRRLITKLIVIFLLGAFQAFLGWFMVKSGLVSQPRVSHYRLAAHLTAAFLTFCFTLWVALDLWKPVEAKSNAPVLKKLLWVFFPLLFIQVIYGAFVAGMDAGLVHNHFPKMEPGHWVASSAFVMEPWYLNFFESKSGIQFVHRYMAYVVAGLVMLLWYRGRKVKLSPGAQTALNLMLVAVVVQFLLGVFTLIYSVPIVLGVLHQSGALLLLGASVYFAQQARFFKSN